MMADRLINWKRYFSGEPWTKAFEFLETLTPESEVNNLIPIQGEDIFARIMSYPTRPPEEAMLEAHDNYIDIQMSLVNTEGMEWYPRPPLEIKIPYDTSSDALFFHRPGNAPVFIRNAPGMFVVFFPNDAHLCQVMCSDARETVKKVVVKVRLALLDANK
ncbi:MAG: YhcH/YjgK/YiaL family protein [Candidatus Hydrogenedentes bacterium]|nr:YhcH/YjgK/YiaL family protein [Candidatus Hydrogenedentota bacterium]